MMVEEYICVPVDGNDHLVSVITIHFSYQNAIGALYMDGKNGDRYHLRQSFKHEKL